MARNRKLRLQDLSGLPKISFASPGNGQEILENSHQPQDVNGANRPVEAIRHGQTFQLWHIKKGAESLSTGTHKSRVSKIPMVS